MNRLFIYIIVFIIIVLILINKSKVNDSIYINKVYPYRKRLPSSNEISKTLKYNFIPRYQPYINDMINYLKNKILNSDKYLSYLNDYISPNEVFQKRLLELIPKFDNFNQPYRIQMITVSGKVFADNFYEGSIGDVSEYVDNVYNNPEILQTILYGVGGMRRCIDGQTQSLRFAFGVENEYGTIVITRILFDIPE
jgi:hypothetical protein